MGDGHPAPPLLLLHRIVHGGDRHRLGRAPIAGGEGQGGRGEGHRSRCTQSHVNGHSGGGKGAQRHRVVISMGRTSRLSDHGGAVCLDNVDPHDVVVPHCGGDTINADGAVEGIDGGGVVADGHRPVATLVYPVVHPGDGHRLGALPVTGGEGQGGRAHRHYPPITRCHGNLHIGGGLAVQHHRVVIGETTGGLVHQGGRRTTGLGDGDTCQVVVHHRGGDRGAEAVITCIR